jgi:hypothetical protein
LPVSRLGIRINACKTWRYQYQALLSLREQTTFQLLPLLCLECSVWNNIVYLAYASSEPFEFHHVVDICIAQCNNIIKQLVDERRACQRRDMWTSLGGVCSAAGSSTISGGRRQLVQEKIKQIDIMENTNGSITLARRP